jgi:hypothetical protein
MTFAVLRQHPKYLDLKTNRPNLPRYERSDSTFLLQALSRWFPLFRKDLDTIRARGHQLCLTLHREVLRDCLYLCIHLFPDC